MNRKTFLAPALAAGACVTTTSVAALLGISLSELPLVTYDTSGSLSFSSTSGSLSISATPLLIILPGPAVRTVNPVGTTTQVLTADFVLGSDGSVRNGVPGDDLIITGSVDIDGDTVDDVSGILLTGEISEFGFLDSGGITDEYDVRFTCTGGLLADDYFLNKDIGLLLTSESSSFVGSFAGDFGGEAKGQLGPIVRREDLQGCTPGYWKQEHHFDSWPAAYAPTDLFEDVFGRDVLGAGSPTLAEALQVRKGGENALIRHAVAALLNAASTSIAPDPLFDTPGDVILAFQAAFDSGDYETTKDLFDDSNNNGCPLN